jgi:hypothetical protein
MWREAKKNGVQWQRKQNATENEAEYTEIGVRICAAVIRSAA